MADSGGESAMAVVTIPGLRGGEGSLVLVKLSDRGTTAHVYQRENPRLWTWYVDQITPANADQPDSAPLVVAAGTADSRVEAIESAMSAFAVHYERAPVFVGARLRNLRWRLEEAEAAEAAKAEAEFREACRRRTPIDGAHAQILEAALSRAERERDEARAEGGCAECAEAKAALRWSDDVMPSIIEKYRRERDEARAEVRRTYRELSESIAREAEAFERGAEAMREAAAREVDRLLTKKKATAVWVSPEEIRAMPIPEIEA